MSSLTPLPHINQLSQRSLGFVPCSNFFLNSVFVVNITFDAATATGWLIVSSDRKKVNTLYCRCCALLTSGFQTGEVILMTRLSSSGNKVHYNIIIVFLPPIGDKQVSLSSKPRKLSLPNESRRFDSCVSILGKQSFTSGRRYWVVQVGA